MDEKLKKIEEFHGHLGPYVVIGYRMGEIAKRELNNDPFKKNVVVLTGNTPPISCMADGIQLSSGCTLGKGNIQIQDKKEPSAIFKDFNGKQITISLKKQIQKEIDSSVTEENQISYSEKIFKKPEKELFVIK